MLTDPALSGLYIYTKAVRNCKHGSFEKC